MQLLVLGMHRAGTSAVTRIVNLMGAYFGPEGISAGYTADNPKGFWERKDFMAFNRQILKERGCTWFKVDGWDAASRQPLPEALRASMKAAVLELDAHRPWVLKDPRLCITLPEWLPLLEVPAAIIVSRDPLEIARSLQMRGDVPLAHGIALWEYYAVHTLRAAAGMPRVFVRHDRLMSDPVAAAGELYRDLVEIETLGLRAPTRREILAFIDPALQRSKPGPGAAGLTPVQQRLNAMLRGEEAFDPAVEVSPPSRAFMQALDASLGFSRQAG
ncbi:MAG TPA: hypothetical protein VHZ56_10740 [Devosia sp.]|nr:hypothetical protein [Devosia sp.]